MTDTPSDRCRLVLMTPPMADDRQLMTALRSALSGGDVASLILSAGERQEQAFQALAEEVVALAHERGIAVMIADDTRIAGRCNADGVHLEDARATMAETMERFDGKLMFGAGGAKTRHDALELGEAQPDYMFFGRIGYDNKPDPHPRNLAMAEWWAQMVAIPCVTMGGTVPESALAVAQTRSDFVALSSAVFSGPESPAERVAAINEMLDAEAPRFTEETDG
ncbi:thiamine phosphate synthase [Notoacmeibacter marinus]|uniref:thiamine phosphate synthase n=1 Tax=Notoacmeibacter marinus TaxID=1876515 RepID=UPI000DF1CCC9|nr:thiamine phosphate synthase [Notoacmeibacter marinus]